ILTAGVSAFLVVNHDSKVREVSIPPATGVSVPVVAAAKNNPVIPAAVKRPDLRREAVTAAALSANSPAISVPSSIDMGGLVGSGGGSSSNSVTNPTVNSSNTAADAKRDLQENAFKVDGSTVNAIVSTVNGAEASASSEYRVRVESTNIDNKSVVPLARTTELKTELISSNLGDLGQPSINIPPSGGGFVGRDSEIVIISHPLVPWTTSINRLPDAPGTEGLISRRSPYSYNQTKVAFAGKLFNQVDKVWIDQDFAASSNLPV